MGYGVPFLQEHSPNTHNASHSISKVLEKLGRARRGIKMKNKERDIEEGSSPLVMLLVIFLGGVSMVL